jgi:hypothetical protein
MTNKIFECMTREIQSQLTEGMTAKQIRRVTRRVTKRFECDLMKRLKHWHNLATEVKLLRIIAGFPSDGSASRAWCDARLPAAVREKIEAQRRVEELTSQEWLREAGSRNGAEIFLDVYEPEGPSQ